MFLVFLGVVSTLFFEETEVQKKEQYLIEKIGQDPEDLRIEEPEIKPVNRTKLFSVSVLFIVICIVSYKIYNEKQ